MQTLIDALRKNAEHTHKGITFVRSDGREQPFSYRQIWERAHERACFLRERGIGKGDRIVLALPEPDDFVLTFFGALVAGAVPVPLYPPQTLARLDAYLANLSRIVEVSEAKLLVTGNRPFSSENGVPEAARALFALPSVRAEEIAEAPRVTSTLDVEVRADDLAFLQFTSGSTSSPKGVMVTHGNLEANARAIMFDGLRADPDRDKGVSWLPLYHDMGLIGFVIAPLFAQVPVVLLPPTTFVRRPSSWLDAIHRHRGTITFAPNFAYALAVQSASPRQMEEWDLSCLRALGCGAEPIDAATVRAFMDKFEPAGLKRTAILPSYGLAESTLAVTFADLDDPLTTDTVDPHAILRGRAVKASNGHAIEVVSCGRPFPGHRVEVEDESGRAVGERVIGEIVVEGPSVTPGYFGDPAATRAAFRNGRLYTGDLGYFAEGRLYVCGRSKDLIILRGRNYFPQDIEKIISEVDGVRPSQVAVFTRPRDRADDAHAANGSAPAAPAKAPLAAAPLSSVELASSDERLVAVAEIDNAEHAAMRRAIVAAVHQQMGLRVDEVHFLRRGSLPKTSSGKVRRRETRARLEAGTLALATTGEE
ncbi:MAG TPA: fatty acyl-AMP ligase [Polyangiaceae bacterium]|nr:fatty acyl-AMP ligase [Polyangiaceae bacterium]